MGRMPQQKIFFGYFRKEKNIQEKKRKKRRSAATIKIVRENRMEYSNLFILINQEFF